MWQVIKKKRHQTNNIKTFKMLHFISYTCILVYNILISNIIFTKPFPIYVYFYI